VNRFDRWLGTATLCTLVLPGILAGQGTSFFGAAGGITTLSSDSRSVVSPTSFQFSQYEADNGATLWVIGGWHFHDYLSAQASYGWNRNRLRLTATEYTDGEFDYYIQERQASQHSLIGELMLYFRNRNSRVRPYLSAGVGAVRIASGDGQIWDTEGTLAAPGGFSSTGPALRVAVGIDLAIKDGWAFRYMFSETIKGNPISAELTPAGGHSLKKFQNLFGLVKSF